MDGTAFIIIFVIALIGFITYGIWRAKTQTDRNNADGVIATLALPDGALRLTSTELIEGWGDNAPRHPLTGLTAAVEDSGSVNRRLTVTRMATLGVLALALPKKLDDRELYLMIEGPETVILRAVQVKQSPNVGAEARKFAMRLNQLAARS